jgi:hypothetical protein
MKLRLSVRILYKSEDLQSLSYAQSSLNFWPKVIPILSIKSTSESSRSIKDENDRHNNTGEPNRHADITPCITDSVLTFS